MSEVRAGEVCQRAGITYRQLDMWTRNGYVTAVQRPTRQAGKTIGSGVPRTWAVAEVEVIAAMVPLVAAGLLPEAAARAVRHGGWLAKGVRILVGEDADAPELVAAALDGEQVPPDA